MALSSYENSLYKKRELQLAEAQNQRNEEADYMRSHAHDRFMLRRKAAVESNPMSYSPQERERFLGMNQREYELKEHEMDMLKQQGLNDKEVQLAKNIGMENQGAAAAKAAAEASKYGADKTLSGIEKQWAAQQAIAETQAGAQKSVAETQAGATVKAAEVTGAAGVARQAEANKAEIAKAEAARVAAERGYANDIVKAQIAAGGRADVAAAANQARIIAAAMQAGATMGKDPQTVAKELQEQYKDDPAMLQAIGTFAGTAGKGAQPAARGGAAATTQPVQGQEGQEQKLADGRTAVFRGGKWVIKE